MNYELTSRIASTTTSSANRAEMLPQRDCKVGLRPSHHQLPACGLRICQTHVLETVADVAETLVQPSGVAAWWMCNLGTQYIKCSIIFPIQKLSFEARGGGIACLY